MEIFDSTLISPDFHFSCLRIAVFFVVNRRQERQLEVLSPVLRRASFFLCHLSIIFVPILL